MTGGGAQAGGLERVLDGHRHAVQRPPQLAARKRSIRLLRTAAGAGLVQRADGVKRRVMARDAREMQLDQLARREAARAQGRGELCSAREGIDRHAGILARTEFRSRVAIIGAGTTTSATPNCDPGSEFGQCSIRTNVRPRSTSFALGRSNMKSSSATAISL